MQIKFLGAAGTVTGSSYVLTSGSGKSIMIDLGMFQGPPSIEQLNYQPLDYDCSLLSGVVLTHAHLDHCGRLPLLLKRGFKGKIWMTSPTRDLTELSLYDSAKIAKQDRKKALYDKDLVEQTVDCFKTVKYGEKFQLSDFVITMRDAGHIIGSAILEIEDTQSNSALRKIVFSGDLGNYPEDLVEETEKIDDADVVVMESTYGDRLHPNLEAIEALQAEINTIEASSGTLLIPAFSLEKTQDLLHMIMHLKKAGKVLAGTSVFLDSPMAEKATQIYLKYSQFFNSHIQTELKKGNPFDFLGLESILRKEESEGIRYRLGPKIIIAGSGMMTGGRILSHAAYYLPTSSTRLFIVGYQGEGTIGRKILEGATEVIIDKEKIAVKANINSTKAMSSHADQQQLLNWLKNIRNVSKVILTHGEDPSRHVLAQKVSAELGIADVTLPKLNQEISF
jgi:metallo-beta-lactamase family protein